MHPTLSSRAVESEVNYSRHLRSDMPMFRWLMSIGSWCPQIDSLTDVSYHRCIKTLLKAAKLHRCSVCISAVSLPIFMVTLVGYMLATLFIRLLFALVGTISCGKLAPKR